MTSSKVTCFRPIFLTILFRSLMMEQNRGLDFFFWPAYPIH